MDSTGRLVGRRVGSCRVGDFHDLVDLIVRGFATGRFGRPRSWSEKHGNAEDREMIATWIRLR